MFTNQASIFHIIIYPVSNDRIWGVWPLMGNALQEVRLIEKEIARGAHRAYQIN